MAAGCPSSLRPAGCHGTSLRRFGLRHGGGAWGSFCGPGGDPGPPRL